MSASQNPKPSANNFAVYNFFGRDSVAAFFIAENT